MTINTNQSIKSAIVFAVALSASALLTFTLTRSFISITQWQQQFVIENYKMGYEDGVKEGIRKGMIEAIILLNEEDPLKTLDIPKENLDKINN